MRKPLSRGVVLAVATLLTMGLASVNGGASIAPAKVAAARITGRLNTPGYVIAAVGFNGKMTLASGQSFSLRAPQSQYTLQLLSTHGVYAGPVVVGGTKTKVIVGLQGTVRLGTIDVVAAKGYGHVAKRLPAGDLVDDRWATAKAGVPIANGRNLGLVVSKVTGGGTGPGQDEAHTGIPNELSIAVPGTKVLRALSRKTTAISAKVLPTLRALTVTPTCNTVPASVVGDALGVTVSMVESVPDADTQNSIDGLGTWIGCVYEYGPGSVGIEYKIGQDASSFHSLFDTINSSYGATEVTGIGDGAFYRDGGSHGPGTASPVPIYVLDGTVIIYLGGQPGIGYDDEVSLVKTVLSRVTSGATSTPFSGPVFDSSPTTTSSIPVTKTTTSTTPSGSAATNQANAVAMSPWMSQLGLVADQTVNVDASGVTQAEIDNTLAKNLSVLLVTMPTGSLVELDCNGLSYCSPGGTGEAEIPGGFSTVAFPSATLDPATGYGEVVGPAAAALIGTGANPPTGFWLEPDATSEQIGSGDVITEVVTDDGVTTETPTTLDFVFVTVPAIDSYSDTAGDSGSITYPDASNLGMMSNPLNVAAGPNGDVVVTFTVWRPQRRGVAGAGEPAFMDIGGLSYAVSVAAPSATTSVASPVTCPATSYSNLSSTLSLGTGTGIGSATNRIVDDQADQPASSADTFSFTVDLSQCLMSGGVSSFPIGVPVGVDLDANTYAGRDHAGQGVYFERSS